VRERGREREISYINNTYRRKKERREKTRERKRERARERD
jgi:hypothetical protein